MKSFFEDAKKNSILDPKRKEEIKKNISIYMQKHPIASHSTVQIRWADFASMMMQKKYYTPALVALMILIIGSGVTVVNADRSLPGDFLYPVKVGVAEPLRQVLAFSEKAKAKVSIDLAETRLQEAEKLSVQGSITPQIQAEIQKDFKKHSDTAIERISRMQNVQEKDTVSARFEISITDSQKKLNSISSDSVKSILNPLLLQVDDVAKNLLEIRSKGEKNKHDESGDSKKEEKKDTKPSSNSKEFKKIIVPVVTPSEDITVTATESSSNPILEPVSSSALTSTSVGENASSNTGVANVNVGGSQSTTVTPVIPLVPVVIPAPVNSVNTILP